MARRQTSRPLPPWAGDLPVVERRLSNGLKALVLPRPGSPVVVCDLFYPVGGADEPPGKTGLAHFVEHMLFKGTPRFPKGQIDRMAFLAAGQANAETGEDDTHYWFSFPADRWELALLIEADRVAHAAFDPDEVEAERHVIAEERARDLDSPLGRLDQAHRAVSYLVHPYRNPILGWPEDLRRLTVDDLRAFYRRHYRPEGAVLVVVGPVDPGRALDRVEAHFGDLTNPAEAGPDEPAWPAEPPQFGRRDVRLEGTDGVPRGLYGWHAAPLGHRDIPALDVLSDILTCGRRSRLWSALVDREQLCTWVDAAHEAGRRAGQFVIQAEAVPGVSPERVEAVLRAEIGRLAEEGPTARELARSRIRLESAWRWEQEDLAGLAIGLGHAALWGDWRRWPAEHRAALAVKKDAVREAAATYLVEEALTVAWALPRPGAVASLPSVEVPKLPPRPASPPAPQVAVPLVIPASASCLKDFRPRRSILTNGLRVLTETRRGCGIVALELFLDAGQIREARPGVAALTARLREEGTSSRSADDVAAAIEDVGGTLDLGPTGVSLRIRAEDLPLAVELLADVAIRPAFPGDALDWARRRMFAELRADRDDPAFRAEGAFRSLVYGDHPLARDPRGHARQIAGITLDDIKHHHESWTLPNLAFLVAVGDFEPRRLAGLLRKHLGGWAPREVGRPPALPDPPGLRPRLRRIPALGEQVHLLIGHLGIRRDDPDFDALCVLDLILGSGPGFTDRLSRVLREELGLAYVVGGGITESADVEPGLFRVYVGTAPEEADRAAEAAIEQIQAIHRGAFHDDEVDAARRYLAGAWVYDFQTVAQRAERLVELERFAHPLDEPIRLPERLARITPRDVRRAARTHLHPEALTRVEYGPIRRRPRKARPACA